MSSFFENNWLTPYTTPPNNYIGSTFFLSYIAAALFLTSTIGYSLYSQYTRLFSSHTSPRPQDSRQDGKGRVDTRRAHARYIKIYTILALISFTSILYHMLGFLITSFLDWNNGFSRNVFSVLGSNAFDKLKRWMLETSLFNDFAMELVGDAESVIWTQLAILATWLWNLWIAGKGRQYNFTTKIMLSFIFLGQNLPISFSVALFIIQLHLAAPDKAANADKPPKLRPQAEGKPIASPVLVTVILNVALLVQPSLSHHAGFSYLLLVERALLVLPYTGLLKLSDSGIRRSAAISGALVVISWAMQSKSVVVGDVLTALVSRGQAVKTMGWDALLSAVAYGVLSWDGGV